MRIIIVGGGNIGSNIARYLIGENHQITLIEKKRATVTKVENQLDAMVICDDATDIHTLDQAGVSHADLLISVTDQDNVNILSAILAKRLNPEIQCIVKVKYYSAIFDDDRIHPSDLNLDYIINPNDLVVEKIISLMDYPEATEIIGLYGGLVQLVGFVATKNYPFLGEKLFEVAKHDPVFHEIRVSAIERAGKLIIPTGTNMILENDRVFCIAKTPHIQHLMRKYIQKGPPIRNLIICSEPQIVPDLVERVRATHRKVTIIEEDKVLCARYSHQLDGVVVINGTATDASVFRELNTVGSCFVSITDRDEFNIVSCATAKNRGISKVMCSIRDMALVKLINSITSIDSVFSSNVIAAGEILKHTRGGHINSLTYFSGVPAEIVEITIAEKIPSLGRKLRDVKTPKGMIVASILRGDEIIIPTGKDEILLNDRVICFLLPGSVSAADEYFGSNLIVGR